jgi:AcrR family transcriptional regulator
MPKVSDDHRRAQEERFVDAARRCFTRLGVENTSMENIRSEAGVSAGLMYRYFPSKNDMIRAAIAGSMDQFEALIIEVSEGHKADTASGFLRLLLETLSEFRRHADGVDLFVLAIQGWAHAQSHPEAKHVIAESIARQLTSYRSVAKRWTTSANSDGAARAVAAAVVGYIVESAFSEAEVNINRYSKGFAVLAEG